MSEKNLNFFDKIERLHFEKRWMHFLLAFVFLMAFGTLNRHLPFYLTLFTSFLSFISFWGLIVTGFDEKRYGDRLKRLFTVFFMACDDLIVGIIFLATTSEATFYDYSRLTIVTLITLIITGIIGWNVGKKIVEQLDEKGFSNSKED